MHVSVIGSGYVGTVVGACLADLGHEVVAVDIDPELVDRLNAGEAPIHEPGLQERVDRTVGADGRLHATTDHAELRDTDVTVVAIQTPSREDGSIDLSAVEAATRDVGEVLADKDDYHLVVVKSTVLPGMVEERLVPALEEASGKREGVDFDVAVNPEFQAQGSAVADFLNPDKLVFGTAGFDAQSDAGPSRSADPNSDAVPDPDADAEPTADRALARLHELYAPVVEAADGDVPVVETGRREAAMVKYANNVFLASKISLINELGNVCKEYGVDSYEVADAIGLDERIGSEFLRSGVGWGGSCFPKDTDALRAGAREKGYEPELLDAVVGVNDRQPLRLLELLDRHVDVEDERVAVLGLAFKPDTDDVRGSRAKPVLRGLAERGAHPVAYDPQAAANMREEFPEVEYVDSAAAALESAVGALVVTDWPEFAALDEEFESMATPVVVDGRRIIENREGIVYEGLTW
ncbi:nucleotide sugar dehydrogenase [Halobium salinum]|uniref:UDP-glucose 6-dehydrogenase n=1 Tax=Halobium salinum TaxID=1364940 RepID=A0ABD5PC59_9EURY|nr:UDP-glucose/GDP-mannose dehydrogenase family protein [Halobium salinum]